VVTPKLLPNLQYSDRVSVFNVYNGPYVLPQHEFDVGQFMRVALSGGLEEAKRIKKRRIEQERKQSMHGTQSQATGSQMEEP
jgi:hypothetical protein